MFLAPEDEPLELHDLEGEARLFRSREASTSGSVEVTACFPHALPLICPQQHVDSQDAQWVHPHPGPKAGLQCLQSGSALWVEHVALCVSVQVDAGALRMALSRQLFGRMTAVNELVLVPIDGMTLIVRVVEANTLDEAAREEAVGYHCYRGLVTPETSIWLATEG